MNKKNTAERLRAFTVHPGWAWALLAGVKKQEWRTFLPNPREGECAIHVSKSYSRSQWQYEAGRVKEMWRRSSAPSRNCCATSLHRARNRGGNASTWPSVAREGSTARSTAPRPWRAVCAACWVLKLPSITQQGSIGKHECRTRRERLSS